MEHEHAVGGVVGDSRAWPNLNRQQKNRLLEGKSIEITLEQKDQLQKLIKENPIAYQEWLYGDE